MTLAEHSTQRRLSFHPNAYQFVFAALRFTQEQLNRVSRTDLESEDAHINGGELLEGIRQFGISQFGLMTRTVFNQWGVHRTDDFGRIVFELIERGDMRKTERDQLDDFVGVYDFAEAFDEGYEIDVSAAFE